MGRGWKRSGWTEKSVKASGIQRGYETAARLIALFHQLPVLIYRQSCATRLQRSRDKRIAGIVSQKTPVGGKALGASQGGHQSLPAQVTLNRNPHLTAKEVAKSAKAFDTMFSLSHVFPLFMSEAAEFWPHDGVVKK
jgi:hypothetical protein